MTNEVIKNILIEKGITRLYHVNSVATACTFLENGGLMSRGAVEDRGLFQTPQETDDQDREVDVFYDIFFDSVDIHKRIGNINHYGPVAFVYSVDLLDVLPQGKVKITKDNPIRWNSKMTESEKYFLSEHELRFGLNKGDFTQHLTVCHQAKPLSFDYLNKMILDNPGVNNTEYFENAYHHLQDLINKYAPGISFEVRQCPLECCCQEQYRSYKPGYIYHKFHFR